ncbi:uncharacterized protein LOC110853083 [Folsomia candida]|uniref:C-type lectin domain-containing protein n=1 Tax=Folsomia candida TaxID=158441 RepID=A0A226E0Z0_FOLCA|nr:uncharacterized protein LOC110853083 [Folsomia candida]OXA51193.1 hypothetical protein Fcan01_14363 [Folsomia candida]
MIKSILSLALIVCGITNPVISQYPGWLVPIGNVGPKTYYNSSESGPDYAQAKFECHKYNMKLAAIEGDEMPLIDSYLQIVYGERNESDMFWTSAHLGPDFTQEVRWSTTNEPLDPDVPFLFRGPMPGESSYVWYECPPLVRSCVIGDGGGDCPGCCGWKTRLIHSIGSMASSNCLEKRRFICQKFYEM